MRYISYLWLSMLLTGIAAYTPTYKAQKSTDFTALVLGDTAIFNELQSKLTKSAEQAAPEKLYLHLDRTLFQPGETVWFSAYLRNASDLAPAEKSQILYVELLDGRGSVLQQKTIIANNGVAAGEFDFSPNWAGGLYKIKAYTNWMRNTNESFERELTLQKVVLPKLNLKLEFERKAHGAGDEVVARLDAFNLENKALSNQKVNFTASVAGVEFQNGNAQTDANGRVYVHCTLPKNLNSPDGLLNITLEYQGENESISRPIPIVLNKIDLQFFPEGGEAVAGLPCLMGFKAVNEFGKPADVEGVIVNQNGLQVANFVSYHDGMGAFDFIPKAGETYSVTLSKPIQKTYQISAKTNVQTIYYHPTDDMKFNDVKQPRSNPNQQLKNEDDYVFLDIKPNGTTLRLSDATEKFATFTISSNEGGKYFLAASSHDKLFYFKELQIKNGQERIQIPTANIPMGIGRFTLFNANKEEIAERLVFLNRDKGLKIEVKSDKEKYLPREKVNLEISVKDHKGFPVEGDFSLAVADEKQLTFADNKQGHILAALLLEQDVKGKIEEPNFYFDNAEPKSAMAMNFLLMTQGYRRFEWDAVMNEKGMAIGYNAEKTELSGELFKANGEKAGFQKVTLYPDGNSQKTDKNGFFCFKNVDITKYSHLQFFKDEYFTINGFQQNIWLSGRKTDNSVSNFYVDANKGVTDKSYLTGKITDKETGEDLIGASIQIIKGNTRFKGVVTNYDGEYRLPLPQGTYSMEVSYTGYSTTRYNDFYITKGELSHLDIGLGAGTMLSETVISEYKVPLIQKDATSGGQTFNSTNLPASARASGRTKPQKAEMGQTITSENIKNLPTRNLNASAATTASTTSIDGGSIGVKGVRSKGTGFYVDGIRVQPLGASIAEKEFEEVQLIANETPADFSNKADRTMSEVVVVGYSPLQKRKRAETGAVTHVQIADVRDKNLNSKDEETGKKRAYYNNQVAARYTRARTFYVPVYQDNSTPTVRNDFRSTIYWNPAVKTNNKGKASVSFVCSDAITNFRATLEGITSTTLSDRGSVGRNESKFFVQKPFSMSVKTPPYVIAGDVLKVQIALSNKTNSSASSALEVSVPSHFILKNTLPQSVNLAANETKIVALEYKIELPKTDSTQVQNTAFLLKAFQDTYETNIETLDRGFPVRQVASGNSLQNAFNVSLIEPVEGTLVANLTAYPSALDEVLKGMERMLRQPGGCFEQVSSSNYPNLLVLDLLRSTNTVKPEVETKALQMLESGYKQLAAYECKSHGFDWWGRDPAHEGLTAYGIMEFIDMSKVYKVDKGLIDRSVEWLLSRRNGQGDWVRREDWHGWQSSGVINAYIAWAIAEAGFADKFQKEIEFAYNLATKSEDPYQLALMANAMACQKDPRATTLVQQLVHLQDEAGTLQGKTHSVMGSSGENLKIETTSLAVLAFLKTNYQGVALQKAIDFIIKSKNEYGYGSTQSTVLALKALVEYAKQGNAQAADGNLVVMIDGKRALTQACSSTDPKRIEIKGLERFFTNQNPRIEVFFENMKKAIPFDIEIKYASRLPKNTKNSPISFHTAIADAYTSVGQTVRMSATLKNETQTQLNAPMMVIGIPAGLTLQPWQLKKIVEEHKCDFYELWDGQAVFHFEHLKAGETREILLDLRADIAGTYEAPASQAFLYYDNDKRVWSKPNALEIRL
jgi:A-macroglobulin TED domain/Carboxypeptidase regulatory-like domain/MG2 domain/Alpha-2-macroglobulin family